MRVLTHAYTEEDLVEGLRSGSAEVIRFIYRKNTAPVKKLVHRFPAITLETEDVLQEAMTRMIFNIREGRFSGKSSLNTYLYSICRNICLKESHREQQTEKFRDSALADESQNQSSVYADYEETNDAMIQRILQAKEQMEKQCIEIIDARFGVRG